MDSRQDRKCDATTNSGSRCNKAASYWTQDEDGKTPRLVCNQHNNEKARAHSSAPDRTAQAAFSGYAMLYGDPRPSDEEALRYTFSLSNTQAALIRVSLDRVAKLPAFQAVLTEFDAQLSAQGVDIAAVRKAMQ